MKKQIMLGLVFLCSSSFVQLIDVSAESKTTMHDESSEIATIIRKQAEIVESMFSNLEETDKVLELPDGGYLHGKAMFYDSNSVIISEENSIVYNSDTDPNSKTVAEVKASLIENGKKTYEYI